jgi:hypothetical protein
MEHIISKEAFLKIKDYQKGLTPIRRTDKNNFKDYQRKRELWVKEKPKMTWTKEYTDWEKEEVRYPPTNIPKEKARACNILYGLLKGKTYSQIEQKTIVKKGDYVSNCINTYINHLIMDFELDKETLKPLLATIPFSWS